MYTQQNNVFVWREDSATKENYSDFPCSLLFSCMVWHFPCRKEKKNQVSSFERISISYGRNAVLSPLEIEIRRAQNLLIAQASLSAKIKKCVIWLDQMLIIKKLFFFFFPDIDITCWCHNINGFHHGIVCSKFQFLKIKKEKESSGISSADQCIKGRFIVKWDWNLPFLFQRDSTDWSHLWGWCKWYTPCKGRG